MASVSETFAAPSGWTDSLRVLCGDVRETLKTLPDGCVNCCVTSPPYWGLRDYGHAGQIGLERTPADYVETMVQVFREVRRVLKDDGTLWLNLGDTYSAHKDCKSPRQTMKLGTKHENANLLEKDVSNSRNSRMLKEQGLKNKDLIGIPWMVAFALRADGWYLRSEITWCKKACMPESMTDRPTSATEKIFLLTKSPRYYYDADAVKEKTVTFDDSNRDRDGSKLNNTPGRTKSGGLKTNQYETRNMRNFWLLGPEPCRDAHFAVYPSPIARRAILAGCPHDGVVLDPFGGSGTTGMVALELGRRAVLCELNPEYVKLINKRTNVTQGFALPSNAKLTCGERSEPLGAAHGSTS